MKAVKTFLLVGAMLMMADFAFAQTWTRTSASTNLCWLAIACSADGSKLVAAASYAIWVSTNSGASWSKTSASNTNDWWWVASSADGTKLVAVEHYNGVICTSSDSGNTWTNSNVPNWAWSPIVLSADGTKLVALAGDPAGNEYIFTSADSGTTWTSNSVPGNVGGPFAISADGKKLVAAGGQWVANYWVGSIFTSTNLGVTWQSVASFPDSFYAVASSTDGEKLVAASNAGYVLISTNSGATWTSNNVLGEDHSYWHSFASSADGNTLVTAQGSELASDVGDGSILISTNSGATWNWADAPFEVWTGFACSADGCKLVGSANHSRYNRDVGGIYTAQIIPTPQLGLTPTNGSFKLSWLIPSTNFVMQQSSDLASWSDVTNAPVLNFTNLQNEVILSPTGSSGFYRLKTP